MGNGKAACRSVKFCPRGAVDLLLFTEHQSYAHLVDTRTYNDQQTIRVAPPNREQHISGAAFSPDCTRLFIGVEEYVEEYAIDTVARRTFGDNMLHPASNRLHPASYMVHPASYI